jgi:DNA-binding transcriptional ArsR family regulator
MRSPQKLETVMKGVSNKHRVAILLLLNKQPNMDLEMIGNRLEIGYKNAAEHVRKMLHAGLVDKEYEGNYVLHSLTPRGKRMVLFLSKIT